MTQREKRTEAASLRKAERMTTLTPRVLDLDALVLKHGSHSPDGEFCMLEAVAYVAGEPWTDSPKCACPVLAAFCRRWNDDLDDAGRQMLKPYIPRLVGSKVNKKVETVRGWMLTDWIIRVYTPAWLRLAKLDEQAHALEGFPEIKDIALPAEGVFHNLVFVSIRKTYPMQAYKIMHGLWGMGQTCLPAGR